MDYVRTVVVADRNLDLFTAISVWLNRKREIGGNVLKRKDMPAKKKAQLPRVRPIVLETVEVASRLKAHRKKKGLSQAKLAELSGVSLNMIYVIETHRSVPTVDILLKLCKALKISPGVLFPGGK